ncbi:MAG: DnaJ domain-containing protein [Thermoleophilia bacterium]|nr:DnaJ domain-containing protein [Thermoleophilia bacterium]
MPHRNFYHVLGVEDDADAQAIRRAHRSLARTLHPDVNKDPDAAQRFSLVQTAYETLSDPQRRAAYDRGLRRGEVYQPTEADLRAHHAWADIERQEFDEEVRDIWETFFEPRARARAAQAENSASGARRQQG